MKKSELLAYNLGKIVRGIAHEAEVAVLDFQGVLSEAMQDGRGAWAKEGVTYTADTVHGYLFGKSWPNMDCAECVAIVTDALERAALPDKSNEERIKKAQQQAIFQIEWAYHEYTHKRFLEAYTQAGSVEAIRASFQHMEPVVAHTLTNNLNACLSLDSEDIAFWKMIRQWDAQRKEQALESLSADRETFQAGELLRRIKSPELAQWLAIRDKDYSETLRKSKTTKTAKDIAASAEKLADGLALTDEMLDSIGMMIAAIQGDGTPECPVYPTVELDLLLMFKYCLTEDAQDAILESWA